MLNALPEPLQALLDGLSVAASATLMQIGLFVLPGIILGLLMSKVSGFVRHSAARLFGWNAYYALFGWVGTVIHEGSHVLGCLIFGHRIRRIHWYDPHGSGPTLGSVEYEYNPANVYQRIGKFFVGVAPIICGTLVMYGVYLLLLADTGMFESGPRITAGLLSTPEGIGAVAAGLAERTTGAIYRIFTHPGVDNWKVLLFLYVAFVVGSSMRLSRADIEGSKDGFITLVIILFMLNIAAVWIEVFRELGWEGAVRAANTFFTAMTYALSMRLVIGLLLVLITHLARLADRRV